MVRLGIRWMAGLMAAAMAVHGAPPRRRPSQKTRPKAAAPAHKAKTTVRTAKKPVRSRPVAPPVPAVLKVASAAVMVQDQRTGEVIYEKRPETVHPIASITKLMTAMAVLDAGQDLQEPIVILEEDVDTLRHSRSRLPVGTQLTREEALLLALMASENRAAHALARTYRGGLEACLVAMNAKAGALGLKDTHFDDPTGLFSSNVSSPRDLARMVDAAHHYPQIRDFSTRSGAEIRSGRRLIAFHNTNVLVGNPGWNIGLSKTGFIQEAGRCLVMQTFMATRPVLVVLLDAAGKYTRMGDAERIRRWLESGASMLGGKS